MTLTGERIRKRRKELDLTQDQLAERCHMSRSQICRIENGETVPNAETLAIFAQALEMKTRDLLPEQEEPEKLSDEDLLKCTDSLRKHTPAEAELLLALSEYVREKVEDYQRGGKEMNPIPELPEELKKEDIRAEYYGLRISFPRESFSENSLAVLRQILRSREILIRKAFGADSVDFVLTEDRIIFPWFTEIPESSDIGPIVRFISALCARAKSGKPAPDLKNFESEKYTFNKLLTAVGLGDSEYQGLRKQLMKNLTGPVPFPDRKSEMLHRERERQNRKESRREGSVLNRGDVKWVPESEAGDDDDEI